MQRYNCSENDILSTQEKCKAKMDPELKLPKFIQHGKERVGWMEKVASTYIRNNAISRKVCKEPI